MNIRKMLLFTVVFVFSTIPVAFGQWGQPSKSEAQEYIEIFVNVGLYAVPYSEPLSVLLSSPDISRMGLHGWVANKHRDAWDDYDDALDRGVRGERLVHLMERANRYQAIYSCLFQNDCTRLKQIESKDIREKPIGGRFTGAQNLTDNWQGRYKVWRIVQRGSSLTVSVPGRGPFKGRVTGPDTIIVDFHDDPNARKHPGRIANGGRTIKWQNGTSFERQ